MLTQQEIRRQLDNIADEVTQPSGLHYELFSRLYSQRVRRWIRSVPHSEAVIIQREIDNDPDYRADNEAAEADSEALEADSQAAMAAAAKKLLPYKHTLPINPAWDMDY